jgi:hypothetical protein
MIAAAKADRRAFSDFEEAGMKVLNEVVRPSRFGWLMKHLGQSDN